MVQAIDFRSRVLRRRIGFLAFIGLALLAPLVAMQFTTDVNWTVFDFAAGAAILGSAALAYEIIARNVNRRRDLAFGGAGICVITLALWAAGAVGIFD